MKATNYSRQREAIYDFLMGRKDHPTAEVIFENVSRQQPRISLGTVYRNLRVLEDTGRIQKIPGTDSKDHYDADISEHPHFVCRKCGAVMDLNMDNLTFLKTLAATGFDGEIETAQLVFYGICENCKENNNNS